MFVVYMFCLDCFGPYEAGYGAEPLDYFVCIPMFGLLYILYIFRAISRYYLPLVNIRMFYFLEVLQEESNSIGYGSIYDESN